MKKLLFVLTVLFFSVLSLELISCKKQYQAGTYTGTGKGYFSDIKVSVTVAPNHKITDIAVLEYGDTPGISDAVFETLPELVIQANGTDIDAVSGATGTSNGLLDAINDALSQAVK